MNIIIDRIEKNIAAAELENGKIVQIPIELLPAGTKEGTCLSITINTAETERRQKRIAGKMDALFD